MEELAKRFADLADKFGPDVAGAVMAAVRVAGWTELVEGLLSGFIGAALAGAAFFWIRSVRKQPGIDELVWLPIGTIALVAFGLLCISAAHLLDPWLWTAFSHPDVWLAHDVLNFDSHHRN